METELLFWALGTGIVSALATGLGAPMVAILPLDSDQVRSFSSAVAAGMMISASVFSLAQEGIDMHATVTWATPKVIVGMLVGTLFLWWLSSRFEDDEEDPVPQLGLSRESLLLFLALVVHSSPEGVAIGVGFATGDMQFGLIMALAISIHNIPEGIAMSLPMRAEGASVWRCAAISTLTSLPQPLLAVPSAWGFYYLQPVLPVGLGFAAGAMIYVTVVELIPDALKFGGRARTAWGVMTGLCAMLTITVILPGG
jgi:ZIP family zinc transporter